MKLSLTVTFIYFYLHVRVLSHDIHLQAKAGPVEACVHYCEITPQTVFIL